MVEHAAKTDGNIARDLFVASSKKPLSRRLMLEKGVIRVGWESRFLPGRPKPGDTYLPCGQRRRVNEEKERLMSSRARWERFGMGLFGGTALIAPMFLMVLHWGRTTALATTSASVILFAVIISTNRIARSCACSSSSIRRSARGVCGRSFAAGHCLKNNPSLLRYSWSRNTMQIGGRSREVE